MQKSLHNVRGLPFVFVPPACVNRQLNSTFTVKVETVWLQTPRTPGEPPQLVFTTTALSGFVNGHGLKVQPLVPGLPGAVPVCAVDVQVPAPAVYW